MPGLVNDFDHIHLDPNGRHLEHDIHQSANQIIQLPEYKYTSNLRSFLSNSKPPIGYVGYIFTKQPVEHVGQEETWAIVDIDRIPASQTNLKNQIDRLPNKDITELDQYSDRKGFKRKQIDELIRICVGLDPDYRFEYVIAFIKHDIRQSGLETSTMQVILKRQPRAGMDMQGPFIGLGSIRLPSSGSVDLSMDCDSIRLPSSGSVDLSYHYNRTFDANSLSTSFDTDLSGAGFSVRSWPPRCSQSGE